MPVVVGETDANLDGGVHIGVGDHVGGTGGVCDVGIGAIGAADPLVAEYGVRESVGVGDGGSPRCQRFSDLCRADYGRLPGGGDVGCRYDHVGGLAGQGFRVPVVIGETDAGP